MNIQEKIQDNHLLAPYCTYQIGGPADHFIEVSTKKDLLDALEWAAFHDMPYFVFEFYSCVRGLFR